MPNEEIMKRVAELLASNKFDDEQMVAVAEAVERSKFPVTGVDVCTHGICIDIGIEGGLTDFDLTELVDVATGPIRSIEIFPEGIVLDDRTRVRLTQAF
ncbi:hypothetical protein [Ruegeria hyattellae]|uniref:hypothetical protein n=1 Tax=Ruegeria hyattellae TaxID=3233337 RepID=UPI00355B8300